MATNLRQYFSNGLLKSYFQFDSPFKLIILWGLLLPGTLQVHAQNSPKRIAVFAADGFNADEFWRPYYLFKAAGCELTIFSLEAGTVQAGSKNRELDIQAQEVVYNFRPQNYDALFIPGGKSPAMLIKDSITIRQVAQFYQTQKPIAAICHGPMLLAKANLLKGKPSAYLLTAEDEQPQLAKEAHFGHYTDRPVVTTGNVIMARYPEDAELFALRFLQDLGIKTSTISLENLSNTERNSLPKVFVAGELFHPRLGYAFQRGSIKGFAANILNQRKIKDLFATSNVAEAHSIILSATNFSLKFVKDSLKTLITLYNPKQVYLINPNLKFINTNLPAEFRNKVLAYTPDNVEELFSHLHQQGSLPLSSHYTYLNPATNSPTALVTLVEGFSIHEAESVTQVLNSHGYQVQWQGSSSQTNTLTSREGEKIYLQPLPVSQSAPKHHLILGKPSGRIQSTFNSTVTQWWIGEAALSAPLTQSKPSISAPEQLRWSLPKGWQYAESEATRSAENVVTVRNANSFGKAFAQFGLPKN